MRILFWGTPEFAAPSLRALVDEGHEVAAVVTQPDRRAGRGRRVNEPAVKEVAREEGLEILQPERARGDAFVDRLNELAPELSVVVAYGQILPRDVLDVAAHGSINVHASLLPALRGAAPINWAIIRGHERTGVTVMRMVEAMDAGPILFQAEHPIGADERASDLSARLSELGAESLIEALMLLDAGELREVEQDNSQATFAPRLEREDARIDWELDADAVARWIRGLDEVPGGWTTLDGRNVQVYRPLPESTRAHDEDPGTVLSASAKIAEHGLLVACGVGAVKIREVKPAGGRRMMATEWVRGRGAAAGDRFE